MKKMNESYRAYLNSPDWKERRLVLLEEANYVCEDCGENGNNVHHLKYDNLGEEELGVDVEVLCEDCHLWGKHSVDGKDTDDGYGEY